MIYYKKRRRYKYTLSATYQHQTKLKPVQAVETSFIILDTFGLLTIKKGYAWDGPSGPAIDTDNFMRSSIVHDALYQLMREKHIGQEHREYADRLLREICIQAGMLRIRAWWVYQCVRIFGASAAKPDLLEAP